MVADQDIRTSFRKDVHTLRESILELRHSPSRGRNKGALKHSFMARYALGLYKSGV
jgi:hypothetical protein